MKRRLKFPVLKIYYLVLVAALFAPLCVLVVFSFNDSVILGFPLSGFTTQWYSEVFTNRTLLEALRNSAIMGVLCAATITLVALLGAAAVSWYKFPGKSLFVGVAVLPLVFPAVLLGVALLLLFRMLGVPLSLWTVGLGEIVICIPQALLIITARLAGMPRSLEEASMDLGATYIRTHLLVTLPIVAPALLAAFMVSFILVFNEFALSFFLAGLEPILPVYMYSMLRNIQSAPVVVAAGAAIILLSLVIIAVGQMLQNPAARRRQNEEALQDADAGSSKA